MTAAPHIEEQNKDAERDAAQPLFQPAYSYYVLSILLAVYIFNFVDRMIIAALNRAKSCTKLTSRLVQKIGQVKPGPRTAGQGER